MDGRPVRYVYQERPTIEKPLSKYVPSYKEELTHVKKPSLQVDTKIFCQKIIGANGSMKIQWNKQRAILWYPPRGLNCLITGPTGSGKTYFVSCDCFILLKPTMWWKKTQRVDRL